MSPVDEEERKPGVTNLISRGVSSSLGSRQLSGASDEEGSCWYQIGNDIDGEGANDDFGSSVAVAMISDGTRLIVGATYNDGINGSNSGMPESMRRWTGTGSRLEYIDGEGADDHFESSAAMNSDGIRVIIGTMYKVTGLIYPIPDMPESVYEKVGGKRTQVGMDIGGEGADVNPGTSVAMSSGGMRVIIGALHIMTGSMGRIPDTPRLRGGGWELGAR